MSGRGRPPLPPRSGEGEGWERAGSAFRTPAEEGRGPRACATGSQRRGGGKPSAGPLPTPSLSLRGGEEKIAFATLAFLSLAACAPAADAPAPYADLDCAQPFEAQATALVAQPGLVPAPKDPNEPYRFYSSADGRTSYLVTEPAAPAHPAIMMQRAKGSDVITTGCPYGDRAGYDQLHAYLDSLKHWTRK